MFPWLAYMVGFVRSSPEFIGVWVERDGWISSVSCAFLFCIVIEIRIHVPIFCSSMSVRMMCLVCEFCWVYIVCKELGWCLNNNLFSSILAIDFFSTAKCNSVPHGIDVTFVPWFRFLLLCYGFGFGCCKGIEVDLMRLKGRWNGVEWGRGRVTNMTREYLPNAARGNFSYIAHRLNIYDG